MDATLLRRFFAESTVPFALLAIGPPTRFAAVNRAFVRFAGRQEADLLGNLLTSLFPDATDHERRFAALPADATVEFDQHVEATDAWVRVSVFAVDGGHVACVVRDVTEDVRESTRLAREADTDALTGVGNRHGFYPRITREMERIDRYGGHLAIILTDIDHFKHVNDTWGHPIGDDVLVRFARLLAAGIRQSDAVYRVGGEEFIVVMPGSTLEAAATVAERLRLELAMTRLPIVGTLTASFGVAAMERKESFRSFYNRVDAAVYKAKNEGRNRIVALPFSEGEIIASAPRYFVWKDEWACGVPAIDSQHRRLVELGNDLASAIRLGGGWSKTFDVLAELLAHTALHFRTEEEILRRTKFPGLAAHQTVHGRILAKAQELADEFAAGTLRPGLILTFLIDDFVIGHLLEEDVKFFPHLADAGAGPADRADSGRGGRP